MPIKIHQRFRTVPRGVVCIIVNSRVSYIFKSSYARYIRVMIGIIKLERLVKIISFIFDSLFEGIDKARSARLRLYGESWFYNTSNGDIQKNWNTLDTIIIYRKGLYLLTAVIHQRFAYFEYLGVVFFSFFWIVGCYMRNCLWC